MAALSAYTCWVAWSMTFPPRREAWFPLHCHHPSLLWHPEDGDDLQKPCPAQGAQHRAGHGLSHEHCLLSLTQEQPANCPDAMLCCLGHIPSPVSKTVISHHLLFKLPSWPSGCFLHHWESRSHRKKFTQLPATMSTCVWPRSLLFLPIWWWTVPVPG